MAATVATVVELVCLDDEVAVMLHVLEGVTPVKSFGGRLQLPASDRFSPAVETHSSACGGGTHVAAPARESPASEPEGEAAVPAGGAFSSGETAAAACGEQGGQEAAQPSEPSSGATLDSVVVMLQRLLSASEPPSAAQRAAALAVAEAAAMPPPAATSLSSSGGGMELPEGVEKLLALELEVVQLQQSLQIAALEFESRTVQLQSLKQRADDAEQRAQVRRAVGMRWGCPSCTRGQLFERTAAVKPGKLCNDSLPACPTLMCTAGGGAAGCQPGSAGAPVGAPGGRPALPAGRGSCPAPAGDCPAGSTAGGSLCQAAGS